jgi:hypothetical protein
MGKNKNKTPEAECGDKPCSSKHKVNQQSAPLASTISAMEKAKNPKVAAAESTLCLLFLLLKLQKGPLLQ